MAGPYSFTTKTTGQTIEASHLNDLQDAVVDIGDDVITVNSTLTSLDSRIDVLEASGGGGSGGTGDAFVTVAASNASTAVKAAADYVCTGSGASSTRKDADTIMTAISALPATGGTVYLTEGTFVVKGTGTASDGAINIARNNIRLIGRGIGATIIRLDSSQAATDLTGIVRTSSTVDVSNVTVADLTVDGNKASCTGRVIGVYCGRDGASSGYHSNIRFERLECKDCYAYGIDPHERTRDLWVLDCWSHHIGGFTEGGNTYGDGITVDWVQGFVVRGCLVHDNARHGINIVTGAMNGLVEGNRARNNTENGITVQLAGGVTPVEIQVRGNIAHDNGTNGIYINKSDRIMVNANTCMTNASDGIRVYGSKHCVVTANLCRDNDTAGTSGRGEIRISSDGGAPRTSDHVLVSGNETIGIAATKAPYGIRVDDTVTNTFLVANKCVGSATPISISSTGTTGTTQTANAT